MMKILKYILMSAAVAFVGLGAAQAQHYIGVRAGYGSGSSRFYPPEEMGTVWGLYSGGVSWKYYSPEKYLGGIEVDALFMQQGYKRFSKSIMYDYMPMAGDTTGYYSRKVNSIMVPLFWQPHIYMFKHRMRVFLNLGVTFSYNINSSYKIGSRINGTVETGEYEMQTTRDNRWGYGLCGGGGITWAAGRMEIFGEVRYYIGYADILKNRNKYTSNPLRSPLDGLQISLGVYWKLGKGGILSARGADSPAAGSGVRKKQKAEQQPPDPDPDPQAAIAATTE